jgi:RNA polymerase sigma-70 factor (ECF subfamily)
MRNEANPEKRKQEEQTAIELFVHSKDPESFATLFKLYVPQLVSFFRLRTPGNAVAEDLAQEVMLTVYRKSEQVRDNMAFRAWVFKIAHSALCRHYERQARYVETLDLTYVDSRLAATKNGTAGSPAFEFEKWMTVLDECERDVMTLRFIEDWEYHEIAAVRKVPIGTVQWRVFNSKKKLARHLKSHDVLRQAA